MRVTLVAIRNAPLRDRERAFMHPLVLASGAFSFVALMALRALDELGLRPTRNDRPHPPDPALPGLSPDPATVRLRQPEALDRARLTSTKAPGLAALLLTLATPAAADGYFGLLGVRSFNSTSTSNSDRIETGEEDRLGGGVLAGLELTRWALLEAELGYASADLHGYNPTPRRELAHGEVRVGYGVVSLGLLAPLPYVQPYLIAGLGFALESVDGTVDGRGRIDDTSAVVAHRYGVGLRIPLWRAAVRTELRHFEAGAVQQDQVVLAVQIGLP